MCQSDQANLVKRVVKTKMLKSELDFIGDGDITNRNVPKDCCSHLRCDRLATTYWNLKINGMEVQIMLCAEHNEEFFNRRYHDVDWQGKLSLKVGIRPSEFKEVEN